MASANVIELTDQNFNEQVISSDKPTLVDFWAEWCMPCRMLTPTVEEIAADYAGRITVGKVNTDENREVSMQYGINAIPTLLIFKDGAPVKKFVGLQSKKDLKAALDDVLA